MKRCICGKSSQFPICDNQHKSQGWSCRQERTRVSRCVLAGPHYISLAEKIAHHLNGITAHSIDEKIVCQELILLSDGSDIEYLHQEMNRISSSQERLLAIGIPVEIVSKAFLSLSSYHQIDDDFRTLWMSCQRALENPTYPTQQMYSSLFISHAVQDEQGILPIVQYIRQHFSIEIFLCTDSIRSGSNWYQTIVEQLAQSQKVIAINSADFGSSTFCAFEMGISRALDKDLSIINLDDSPLPAHLQDIQSRFVPRYQRNKPWLTIKEALSELLLRELLKVDAAEENSQTCNDASSH